MSRVDPYVANIPKKILMDPDREYLGYFEYLNRFLHDLWIRSGGGTDSVEDAIDEGIANNNQIAYLTGYIKKLEDRIDDLEAVNPPKIIADAFADVEVSSNYTANDWEDIDATGAVTIKFPANPSVNSEVIIGNGDGKRKIIDGNGRNIKRISLSSTLVTVRKGTRLHFRYKIDKNIWVLV